MQSALGLFKMLSNFKEVKKMHGLSTINRTAKIRRHASVSDQVEKKLNKMNKIFRKRTKYTRFYRGQNLSP